MHIYLKNNPAEFHADQIWLFEECCLNKNKKNMIYHIAALAV